MPASAAYEAWRRAWRKWSDEGGELAELDSADDLKTGVVTREFPQSAECEHSVPSFTFRIPASSPSNPLAVLAGIKRKAVAGHLRSESRSHNCLSKHLRAAGNEKAYENDYVHET